MMKVQSKPVSVKCRTGVDYDDSYEYLKNFITKVNEKSGCKNFIIHARKALLKGIDTKKNRSIPPLTPEKVFKIKEDFPDFNITMNGEIRNYEDMQRYLDK